MRIPVIFDADSVWARSYFAAANMVQPEGPPQAEIGKRLFLKTVISILNPFSGKLHDTPTETLFCFDGLIAKRDKGRAPKSADYLQAKKDIAPLLSSILGAAHCFPTGEADDAVATAAFKLELLPDVKTIYVVSGDKDLQQLVSNKTVYYSLNEKSTLPWSTICNHWHVKHPSHVAVALAILGDPSDRITGIKGWGPKKVAKLFEPVTDSMKLDVVANLVASSMNEEQLAMYAESLELTLLNQHIPDEIPDPAPINLGGQEMLQQLGWTDVATAIAQLQAAHGSGQRYVQQDLLD